jgi:hypothetical protein
MGNEYILSLMRDNTVVDEGCILSLNWATWENFGHWL